MLDKVVQKSAAELEAKIKEKVLKSVPAGKVYRRTAIKRRIAKRDLDFFRSNQRIFRRQFTTLYNEKTVVGYNFHRASRKGQPFANDTGETLNATRARKIGELKAVVANSKPHAEILDNPNKLNRPFFRSTAEEFKKQFRENLAEAIAQNS